MEKRPVSSRREAMLSPARTAQALGLRARVNGFFIIADRRRNAMKRFPHSVCLALVVLALLALGRPALAEERSFQLQRGHISASVYEDAFASVHVFGEITHLGLTRGGGDLLVLSPTGLD